MRSEIDFTWKPEVTPAQLRSTFPDLDFDRTLRAFIAYHKEKGTLSRDWESKFYLWCDTRQGRVDEKRNAERHTDSMGLPLHGLTNKPQPVSDAGVKFLDRLQHHQQQGLDFEAARRAAIHDTEEGDTNE